MKMNSVNVLQRRHYEDIAVDVVLKAAKKCLRQRLGTQIWYKSIGFSTETSCARTAQSEDTHQESTTSTNAKTRCGAGWWLLVVVLLGRKKVDLYKWPNGRLFLHFFAHVHLRNCVDAHEQRNAKTDGHWATCTDLLFFAPGGPRLVATTPPHI